MEIGDLAVLGHKNSMIYKTWSFKIASVYNERPEKSNNLLNTFQTGLLLSISMFWQRLPRAEIQIAHAFGSIIA